MAIGFAASASVLAALATTLMGVGSAEAAPAATPVAEQPAAWYDDVVDVTLPVLGWFGDDYDAGRAGGRIHRATDLFAHMGTPVHAAMGGVVTWAPAAEHETAGFALQVHGDDGRLYAYYHLGPAGGRRSDALADGVEEGVRVERGQVIGSLGNSGNARTTPPHLHFEIHDEAVTDPYGSHRMNPYPSLLAAVGRGDTPAEEETDDLPPPPPAPPDDDGDDVDRYTVVAGDTLTKIAEAHGIDDWRELLDLNPEIEDPDRIWPDQVLVLRRLLLYLVKSGDTLSEIAEAHGIDDWERLLVPNPGIEDPDLILPGQEIRVPGDGPGR